MAKKVEVVKNKKSKRNIMVSVLICLVLIPIFTLLWIFYGPFETARRVWICTAMSTANHKYLATTFFTDETIEKYTTAYFDSIEEIPNQDESAVNTDGAKGKITVESVNVGLSKGKLMRIPDPSKIDISVSDYIGNMGMTLDNLVIQENAIAGINAGAYADEDGSPKGSIPDGVTVQNGKITFYSENENEEFCIIGFNEKNLLVVDYVDSSEEIEKLNLRCAVTFGPPLIINGEGLIKESGTSLQPRSAIAQCADGSVLFLVLDGRQPNSAGATLKNVQDLLLEKGAVTAANLDGGSSTAMIYNEELLNNPSDGGKLKRIPSAFIVRE